MISQRHSETTGMGRRLFVSILVAALVVVAGCTGTLAEASASPATIPTEALEPYEYVHGNTTELPLTYSVGAAGVSRNVSATTWLSGYSRTTADGDVAGLVLYSSPNVLVEGRSVNPLAQLSNRNLVGTVVEQASRLDSLSGVGGVSDLREIGVQQVTVLGTETELTSYAGTADVDGERVSVVVNIAVVEHADDVVVVLGVHEDHLDESATHAALAELVVHGE